MQHTERNIQLSEWVVNIETGAKLGETIGTVEELSTSQDEWMTTGEEREESEAQTMSNEKQNEDLSVAPWRFLEGAHDSAMTNLECKDAHVSQDLAMSVHEQQTQWTGWTGISWQS